MFISIGYLTKNNETVIHEKIIKKKLIATKVEKFQKNEIK
jgi:hypothetical protein